MGKHFKDVQREKPFDGTLGHTWNTNGFENIIANIAPGLDCVIGQHSYNSKSTEMLYGKAEYAWTMFMCIIAKYSQMMKPESLNSIQTNKHFKEYNISQETADAIDTFFNEHDFIYWDKPSDMQTFHYNSPFHNTCFFIINNENIKCLTAMEYIRFDNPDSVGIRLNDAIQQPTVRDKAFQKKIVYGPNDCKHLLEGIIMQSPFKYGMKYAIMHAQDVSSMQINGK